MLNRDTNLKAPFARRKDDTKRRRRRRRRRCQRAEKKDDPDATVTKRKTHCDKEKDTTA
jgi:hypothetical protein